MELLTILPFRITGSTHLWNSDNPSYWNYGINTFVELKQSFLLELRDQFNDPSFQNYGNKIDVELRQSFLLELRDQFNDPSFQNYGI